MKILRPTGPRESGQALIELMFVVIISVMFAIGIYEGGALLHNLSILNDAMKTAANYASEGAHYEVIQEVVVRESENLLSGAFLAQTVPRQGLILEVWNPETNQVLGSYNAGGVNYRSQCKTSFAPHDESVSPYLFWAQGYVVRVGVNYRIGFAIPFLWPITLDMVVAESQVIKAQNDIDRDGMTDGREAEYVGWAMKNNWTSDSQWVHPVHRDGYQGAFDTENNVDFDGDGSIGNDTAPYDMDQDGTEDKFDEGATNNQLDFNPVVGPIGWLGGSCP